MIPCLHCGQQTARLTVSQRYCPACSAALAVLKALVLREMERDWRQLQARYSAFVEFLDLVSADLAKVS